MKQDFLIVFVFYPAISCSSCQKKFKRDEYDDIPQRFLRSAPLSVRRSSRNDSGFVYHTKKESRGSKRFLHSPRLRLGSVGMTIASPVTPSGAIAESRGLFAIRFVLPVPSNQLFATTLNEIWINKKKFFHRKIFKTIVFLLFCTKHLI